MGFEYVVFPMIFRLVIRSHWFIKLMSEITNILGFGPIFFASQDFFLIPLSLLY